MPTHIHGVKVEFSHIEDRYTITAIESFDEAVLHRPSRFNELEQQVMLFSAIGERQRLSILGPLSPPLVLSSAWGMQLEPMLDQGYLRNDSSD